MEKLSDTEIQEKLKTVKDWRLFDEKWIERKYRFPEFLHGINFVQQVADLSEKMNHHPFISIDYKLVTLKLTSWHAKGITALDFELAQKCEELFEKMKNKM